MHILCAAPSPIDDPRSARHTDHFLLQPLRQRAHQVGAGYEDGNDADHLRVDPALRLTLGKEHESGAGESTLCRLENKILADDDGLKTLEESLSRSAETFLRRTNKRRLIIDVDSTEDPVNGNPEGAAFNGYFVQVCYHPLFCLTNKGDLLSTRLGPGNAHSADGVIDLTSPLVNCYRSWFEKFWNKTSCHLFTANQARLLMDVLLIRVPHGPGWAVLGTKRQTIHRVGYHAACKGWGQSGLPCQKAVRRCC